MSIIGPIGLLIMLTPAIWWILAKSSPHARFPQRRRDLLFLTIASGIVAYAVIQVIAFQEKSLAVWELALTPALCGLAIMAFVLVALYAYLWLLDSHEFEFIDRLTDLTLSIAPEHLRQQYAQQRYRGPFWAMFTPMSKIDELNIEPVPE